MWRMRVSMFYPICIADHLVNIWCISWLIYGAYCFIWLSYDVFCFHLVNIWYNWLTYGAYYFSKGHKIWRMYVVECLCESAWFSWSLNDAPPPIHYGANVPSHQCTKPQMQCTIPPMYHPTIVQPCTTNVPSHYHPTIVPPQEQSGGWRPDNTTDCILFSFLASAL